MSYENLKSTKLLARRCCVCSRPLRDAETAELGIGRDCAEKHGFNLNVDPKARAEANKLIFEIADKQTGVDVVEAVRQLRNLGFTVLAQRIATRLFEISIVDENGMLYVTTPFTEAGVAAFRALPAGIRAWDKRRGAWAVSGTNAERWVWHALKQGFPGYHGIGRQGQIFRIPGGVAESETVAA